MRPSNTHKSHKKNSLASENLRFNFDPIHETDRNPCNLRVVQPHLLYALGIHPEISSEKTLCSKRFFGKYGKVQQIMINKKGGLNKKHEKKNCCTAHITYNNDISASLALISLFEFKYCDNTIRSSFGYSKYCELFFYKKQCYKKDCVYLHEIKKDQQIMAGKNCDRHRSVDQSNFEKELALAMKLVFKNRKSIIEMHKNEEGGDNGFLPVYEVMKVLVSKGYMTEQEYLSQWGKEKQQVTKCSTEETKTSPSKQETADEDKPASEEEFWMQDLAKERECSVKTESKSISKEEQIEDIDDKISRKILRAVRSRYNQQKSRFLFAEDISCSPIVKSILERELAPKLSE